MRWTRAPARIVWKNNIVDYKPGIGGIHRRRDRHPRQGAGRHDQLRPHPETDDHCYISAYDAKTGKRAWKFLTVALKGEPGGDTWGDLPDDQRAGAETWIAGHL